MNLTEVMIALEKMGNPKTKKVLLKHGAREPIFGVKVGDIKDLVKKIKKDHPLALSLYNTGNSDAMYLAGLIADEQKTTKLLLQQWVDSAYWYMLSDYTVAWLAADTPHGWDLGLCWIDSKKELVASAGWSTLSNWVAIQADHDLDLKALDNLLSRVVSGIADAPNRVRYSMNGFVIALGSAVSFFDQAVSTARQIGKIEVEMGGTACQVPDANSYLEKIASKGRIGKKKKKARC